LGIVSFLCLLMSNTMARHLSWVSARAPAPRLARPGASGTYCVALRTCLRSPHQTITVPGQFWEIRKYTALAPSLHGFIQKRHASSASQQFEKQLMPEDILHLRATSMTIMQDPVCELQSQEVQKYVVKHRDPIGDLPLWHPRRLGTQLTQPNRMRKLAVQRFTDLIIERIDNEPLCRAFGIDSGFNMQVYFMMIHTWLLHQRLVVEGSKAKRLDEDLFESCWTLVRNWMWLKKIPEYRFDAELRNVQEYMLGCCIAMDKALERPDILPARLQQTLWANVYSGNVKRDADGLTRLTKYCLRQLDLMLQLEGECFLSGSFVWADFPVPDNPQLPERPKLPLWREEFGRIIKQK